MGFLKEPSHILLIVLVLVILFGSRRLPDVARGMGQSMRIFKSEVKKMKDDDETPAKRTVEPVEPLEGKVVRPQSPRVERTDEPVRETPRNI
jgi:sec-independent protein translocase protein TatA